LPEAPSGRGGHFCITLQVEKQKCCGGGGVGASHYTTISTSVPSKNFQKHFSIHYLATLVNHLIEIG